jgi:hypothetical protein
MFGTGTCAHALTPCANASATTPWSTRARGEWKVHRREAGFVFMVAVFLVVFRARGFPAPQWRPGSLCRDLLGEERWTHAAL